MHVQCIPVLLICHGPQPFRVLSVGALTSFLLPPVNDTIPGLVRLLSLLSLAVAYHICEALGVPHRRGFASGPRQSGLLG